MLSARLSPDRERAWRFFFALGALSLATGSARAEPFHGLVYEAGTGRKTPLFKLKRTEAREADGTSVIEGFYTPLHPSQALGGSSAEDAIHDVVRVKDHKLLKFTQEQNQIRGWGTLEARGTRIRFEWVDSNREVHTGEEENPANLIVGATSLDYLKEHRNELLAGKGVDVRFAVMDRQETIGFSFRLVGRESREGKELIRIRMKPTSVFVQFAVKPIEMTLERETFRLLELKGYVGLKKRVGKGWKDLEAEMVYEYDDRPVSPSKAR